MEYRGNVALFNSYSINIEIVVELPVLGTGSHHTSASTLPPLSRTSPDLQRGEISGAEERKESEKLAANSLLRHLKAVVCAQ